MFLKLFSKIAAFLARDVAIARSYRAAFFLQGLQALFGVASFYYLSRFVESEELTRALPQGGTYFAFALVGFAFFDYLGVSLVALESSVAEARQNGTLEAILVTQTGLPVMLAGSVLYPFAATSLRTLVYLAWGIFLFDFPVASANWLGAAVILFVSIVAFLGLGVLSLSYTILFKRGNPANWVIMGLAGLLGGMIYPVSVLPDWLQVVARLIPVTYSLEGMRASLLAGAPFADLWPSVAALLLFSVILLPFSFAVFNWALRRTKVTGTLSHF